jgi:hypothetical protein
MTPRAHVSANWVSSPEDMDIPIGIVARLWAETGSLDGFEAEDFLKLMVTRIKCVSRRMRF